MNHRNKIRPLVEICQQELMKNPKLLENVSNVPYNLLSMVFKEINLEPEQLKQLEKSNIFYIFEDDELWLSFLRKEYPTHVPDSYVSHKSTIENYYMKIFESYERSLDEREIDLFDRYVMEKVKKDRKRNKYRIPYRMLFETYQNDVERKKMKSAERLRESVHKLDEERKRNQTVTVDYSMLIHQQGQGKNSRRRKEYWDDRTPIKSIDKHNASLQNAMNQVKLNPPTRVAFGGVAGRPLDKLPTMIRSPMTEMRQSMKSTLVKQKSTLSNDSSSDNESRENDSLQVSPRRRSVMPVSSSRRNQSTQNIFLNKKRNVHVPIRKNVNLNSNKNIDESKTHDNPINSTPTKRMISQGSSPIKKINIDESKTHDNPINSTPTKRMISQGSSPIKKINTSTISLSKLSESRPPQSTTTDTTTHHATNTGTRKRSKFFHNIETTTENADDKNSTTKQSGEQITSPNKRVKRLTSQPSIHEHKSRQPGYHNNGSTNETTKQNPKPKRSLQNYLTSKRG